VFGVKESCQGKKKRKKVKKKKRLDAGKMGWARENN